jgi:hypothetical protein
MKIITVLKSILVFENGELIDQIRYRTKREAIGNFRIFKKFGYISPYTWEKVENATFEIL